ncbi:MAG: hypothetical protein HZA50_07705 [Planctomycetes bacterium]|nr:hypothetical protein [Planctomycetota bacterium]
MTQARKMLAAWYGGVFLAFFFGGCLPDDMPAYVNDGKTIVACIKGNDNKIVLWTYDVKTKTAASHPAPDDFQLKHIRTFGDQVWLSGQTGSSFIWKQFDINEPASQPADRITRLIADLDADDRKIRDQAMTSLIKLPSHQIVLLNEALEKSTSHEQQMRLRNTMEKISIRPYQKEGHYFYHKEDCLKYASAGAYEGKKCVFLSTDSTASWNSTDKLSYDVLSLPDLSKLTTVELNKVIPAGRFWWITLETKKIKSKYENQSYEIQQIDLYNQEGKKVVAIAGEEGKKLKYERGRGFAGYARLSDDDKTLLFASGDQSYYMFGLFDVGTGKFLWGGNTVCGLKGHPLVKSTEVWFLEWSNQHDEKTILLVRYSKEEKNDKCNKEIILKYPLQTTFSDIDQFNISPDSSHFIMSISYSPPRLLFIPIRKGVTEKDVEVVKLQAATAPATTSATTPSN